MNVAVLLTGHYRTFDQTYPAWKEHVIDKYGAELYMHTWDNVGLREDLQPGEINPRKGSQANAVFSPAPLSKEIIQEKHGVSNIILENFQEVQGKELFRERTHPVKEEFLKRGFGNRRILWFLSQSWKRKQGINWILSQDKKYDAVLLSRPDFQPGYFPEGARGYRNPTLFDISKANSEKLYLSKVSQEDGFHDFYMLGSPEVLRNCCEIYDHFEVLVDWFKQRDFSKMSCGHALLTTYVAQLKQIPWEEIGLLGYIRR